MASKTCARAWVRAQGSGRSIEQGGACDARYYVVLEATSSGRAFSPAPTYVAAMDAPGELCPVRTHLHQVTPQSELLLLWQGNFRIFGNGPARASLAPNPNLA